MAGFEGGASEEDVVGAVEGLPESAAVVVDDELGGGADGTVVAAAVGVVGVPSPLLARPQNLVKTRGVVQLDRSRNRRASRGKTHQLGTQPLPPSSLIA
jgi:hypothetical protein